MLDKNTKKLITENINSRCGFHKITDCRKLFDMAQFFKANNIHFGRNKAEDIEVTQDGQLVAIGHRRFSQHRICLEYKELKPSIEWIA